jgi:hypothetical protein
MKRQLFFLCGIAGIFAFAVWWTWSGSKSSSVLPVVWSSGGIPSIEVSIDEEKQLVKLCSSDKFFLSVNELGYKHLKDTTKVGTVSWHDRCGNSYEAPSYHVKKILVGPIAYSDMVVPGASIQDEEADIIAWNNSNHSMENFPKTFGELGLPFFAQTSLLLDLGHDKIIVAKNDELCTKYGLSLDNMKKFSLEPDERGIILKVHSDLGPLRLGINTGATLNLIRSSLVQSVPNCSALLQKDYRGLSYCLTDLIVNSTTFKHQKMYEVKMSDGITWMDGCLGVEFLKEHLVYIDYPNRVVYIQSLR